MKPFFSALLFLISYVINAQVGIGTVIPNAQLEIVSSNQLSPSNTDGILIPKIDVFPLSNPTILQQGMLVYLNVATGTKPIGFYYWDFPTLTWVGLQSSNAIDWNISGNAGTNSNSNFIGTKDDVDLIFRRNSIRAGIIGSPTGNKNTSFGGNSFNIGMTGTRNTAFGSNALALNSTGNNNTTTGDQSMFSNTTGSDNVAFGTGALYSSQFGVCNVAIGRNALTSTNGLTGTEGSNNTGIGYLSMRSNTKGAFNSAVGRESLYTNLLGNNNTSVGYQSGFLATGNNNVFIGNTAGYSETGNNKLYIENSNADAVNALVYGEFDTKILRTNGTLQIGNPATSGYVMPNTRGTLGQVLQTNATGIVSWQTPINSYSVVRTNIGANQNLTNTGWQKINFNVSVFDTNSEFSVSSNRFIALRNGYYEINAGFHTDNQSNNQFYSIGVYKNGSLYQEVSANHFGNGPVTRTINCVVGLIPTDYIEIYIQNYQNSVIVDSFPTKTYFEVKQIK
ncbi:MAG: hypothetical protein H7239_10955 [Flavobacterium sp.]|nr:hypothetical protein [Flavobacterium sp.]